MFKANLIEDPEYYRLRRTLLLIGLPASVLGGSLSLISDIPISWTIILIIGALGGIVIEYRLRKGISVLARNRRIEIAPEKVVIKSRSGKVEEEIDIARVERILVKEDYMLPEENLRAIYQEMKGDADHLKNFLILEYDDRSQNLEFIIDSYYMIEQLKKLVSHWQSAGYEVVVVQ
jgi:hypothetical protein